MATATPAIKASGHACMGLLALFAWLIHIHNRVSNVHCIGFPNEHYIVAHSGFTIPFGGWHRGYGVEVCSIQKAYEPPVDLEGDEICN
mmetsp:Transcript_9777/g.24626  ORF Transcript_9777/g.24626 Transcript_9777/m.24626 type:complete len:88 (-) Transcript_9777:75-338(-)